MDAKKPSTRSPTKSSAARSKAGSPAEPRSSASRSAATPRRGPGAPPTGAPALIERFGAGAFPSSLYVEGPDEAVKAAFLAELRHAWARHCPEAPTARVFRPGENSVDDVLAAYHGLSMFAPRELTLVLDVEDFGRSDKRVEVLAAGAARPAGESCLVLVESAADTPRKSLEPLRAACAARFVAEPLAPHALLAWGARRLEREGITAEPGTLEALAQACEGEALAFFNELGKLVSWAGASGRASRADVAALLKPTVGADLPDYLAAVALGRPGLAAQKLTRLLAEGASEGTVMFALANLVGGAFGGWAIHRPLSQELGRRQSPPELARSLDAVYRAESAWKGGRLDALTALEQATREVSRR